MRYVIVAALLAAWPAAAQDPFLSGEALQAAVKEGCAEGCVLFSRADAAALEQGVRNIALQAYAAGKHEGSAGCRL